MGTWATPFIQMLKEGKTVSFNPRGNSMQPKIFSGDRVTVEPLKPEQEPVAGDVVLCSVKGHHHLHLVTAVRGNQFQISNSHGHINGWTTLKQIYGIITEIQHT